MRGDTDGERWVDDETRPQSIMPSTIKCDEPKSKGYVITGLRRIEEKKGNVRKPYQSAHTSKA
jgi:hypothetical protein